MTNWQHKLMTTALTLVLLTLSAISITKAQQNRNTSIGNNNAQRALSLAEKGLSEVMQGNAREANRLAEESLNLKSDIALALAVRGWAKDRRGNEEGARVDLEKANQLDSRNGLFRAMLAQTYINLDRDDLAKQSANQSLQLLNKPTNALEYYARGVVYSLLANDDNAIAEYSKAIELNPQFADAYNRRGVAYIYKENSKQAIFNLNKAIELNQQFIEAYHNRGYAYERIPDFEKAMSDYTRAIELDPQFAIAYSSRSVLYRVVKKNTEQAIRDITKFIELKPEHPSGYKYRALLYQDIGRKDLADADRRKAQALESLQQSKENK